MNGAQVTGADAAEPQVQRLIRDAADARDRSEVIQQRVEALLARVRGDQPTPPQEVATAKPSQAGTFGELASTLERTQSRLADVQGLLGELENYI